ncbi:hypothetical protein GCM10011494_31990 [Novosphingobium endophyticum]|uniref:Uncharacterized protein n=1 Tax=Novosphingobium endophyticum TaxID=1955250 RepID=A0A916TV80_9SPHN|nr:hypothetical protein [Novosphingobium endophyticum]GGC10837.1 hypothetical protein GCM10011494_31990 [Novosphingobium endophyticum]
MAEVLNELGAEVEALGEVLCRDSGFVGKHVRELQAIDLIAQKQRALAAILAAGFSDQEMRRISLDALRSRFSGFIDDSVACGEVVTDKANGESMGLWD